MVTQAAMKSIMAVNFMRSAKAPTMSAGVMIAKVIWKIIKTLSGMVPLRASTVTPIRNTLLRPPVKALRAPPSVNAKL